MASTPDPVLSKIGEAAAYIISGSECRERAFSERSILLHGCDGCFAHLDYDRATGGIVVNFVGCKADWQRMTKAVHAGRATPTWALDADMKVHAKLLRQFDSLLKPELEGQLTLLETGTYLSQVRGLLCACCQHLAALRESLAVARTVAFSIACKHAPSRGRMRIAGTLSAAAHIELQQLETCSASPVRLVTLLHPCRAGLHPAAHHVHRLRPRRCARDHRRGVGREQVCDDGRALCDAWLAARWQQGLQGSV
jgi:hypothetical protein